MRHARDCRDSLDERDVEAGDAGAAGRGRRFGCAGIGLRAAGGRLRRGHRLVDDLLLRHHGGRGVHFFGGDDAEVALAEPREHLAEQHAKLILRGGGTRLRLELDAHGFPVDAVERLVEVLVQTVSKVSTGRIAGAGAGAGAGFAAGTGAGAGSALGFAFGFAFVLAPVATVVDLVVASAFGADRVLVQPAAAMIASAHAAARCSADRRREEGSESQRDPEVEPKSAVGEGMCALS